MYYPITLRFDTGASVEDASVVALHERVEIQGAYVVLNATATETANDYKIVKVLGNDQSTAIYQWSTQDSAEGTLTADTPAELVDQGAKALAIFEAGEAIKVDLTKAGNGVAFDGIVVLNCRQARKY